MEAFSITECLSVDMFLLDLFTTNLDLHGL